MTPILEFMEWTDKTWKGIDHFDEQLAEDLHAALGLCGEAGEVADLIKKAAFTPFRIADADTFRDDLEEELGDVLYYWARLCSQFNFDPVDIIEANMRKLEKRYGQ